MRSGEKKLSLIYYLSESVFPQHSQNPFFQAKKSFCRFLPEWGIHMWCQKQNFVGRTK